MNIIICEQNYLFNSFLLFKLSVETVPRACLPKLATDTGPHTLIQSCLYSPTKDTTRFYHSPCIPPPTPNHATVVETFDMSTSLSDQTLRHR